VNYSLVSLLHRSHSYFPFSFNTGLVTPPHQGQVIESEIGFLLSVISKIFFIKISKIVLFLSFFC
jgi:hypothetical protein